MTENKFLLPELNFIGINVSKIWYKRVIKFLYIIYLISSVIFLT